MSPSPVPETSSRGYIIPIGGAEDKVQGKEILSRFWSLAGGKKSQIAIIPTASRLEDTGERYKTIFESMGGKGMVLSIRDRSDAEKEEYNSILEEATGIFMTGGNQLRLSTILGGTRIATQIRRKNANGIPVAGTSAGAAFISEHMIAFGQEGSTPIAGKVTLAPGLGLSNRVIVDQHFRQRDRLGRLMTALAYNPFVQGIGLDEDTAAFINHQNEIEVVGEGALTIVDVADLEYSSMASAREGDTVELIGVKLHVISHGARYNLVTRKAIPGGKR
ncbi:MAG: cyanophycinase [Deltaproteobacteria bacterium]|nr:cyanophycinase [Deltaproteobacteria bacterium]